MITALIIYIITQTFLTGFLFKKVYLSPLKFPNVQVTMKKLPKDFHAKATQSPVELPKPQIHPTKPKETVYKSR